LPDGSDHNRSPFPVRPSRDFFFLFSLRDFVPIRDFFFLFSLLRGEEATCSVNH
jgi:hypothetical protein